MADILIKNMEMPKNCEACVLHDLVIDSYGDRWAVCLRLRNEYGSYVDIDLEERHPECPLVQLPDHGDLIDRGILTDILEKEIRLRKDNAEEAMLLKGVLYEILNAPVVIPKSGS